MSIEITNPLFSQDEDLCSDFLHMVELLEDLTNGSEELLLAWWTTPQAKFGNKTPALLSSTAQGFAIVYKHVKVMYDSTFCFAYEDEEPTAAHQERPLHSSIANQPIKWDN